MPETAMSNAPSARARLWDYAEQGKDPLLARSRATLRDMVTYHNCDHPLLDASCCCCEAKRIIRDLDERLGGI